MDICFKSANYANGFKYNNKYPKFEDSQGLFSSQKK